jgi:hypothetical protein
MGYAFALFVFGTYVISLWGALSDLPLGDMLTPIRYSLVVWLLMSILYLMGQGVTKRWSGVVLGGISLVTSIFSYGQVMDYLQSIQAPWFVNTLKLEPATRVIIAAVFGIALLYVFLSPTIWRRYLSQDTDFIIKEFLKTYPNLTQSQLSLIKKQLPAKF